MFPPTSAIIFIKCWNRHHIKNNIRYKGNINNTSVIIFLIRGQILPVMLLCLGESPVRFLLLLVVVVHSFLLFFILLLFFIHFCSSFVDVLHSHLLFDIIPHTFSWTIGGFLHPFYTFSPAHRRRFLLLLLWHFTCDYQGLPVSRQFFLEISRVSYWSSKHRPSPSVCLIYSNPQSSYSERFSFKFYHILSWIACGESLIYLLLTRFELFSLVQSICKDY